MELIVDRWLPKTKTVTHRLIKTPRNSINGKVKIYYVTVDVPLNNAYFIGGSLIMSEEMYENLREVFPAWTK